ncbi:MAG TPA: hypothetical protein VF210_21565 [Pseudomonadales bacterium]
MRHPIVRTALLLAAVTLPCRGNDWMAQSAACEAADWEAPAALQCPDAFEALEASPWAPLVEGSVEALSADGMQSLAALVERYRNPATGPRPDPGALDAILAALPSTPAPRPTLWKRLLDWLQERFGFDAFEAFRTAGTALSKRPWILYSVIAVLVLLAAAVVLGEIRRYRRRRTDGAAADAARGPSAADAAREPAAIGSPREELLALFRQLVERLQALGRLPRRPGLTQREAARAAAEPERGTLERVGTAAEQALFAGWLPDRIEVEALRASTQRLLGELPEPRG